MSRHILMMMWGTALALLLTATPAAAQKHIIATADKISKNDKAGQSIENVVKRGQDSKRVETKVLRVVALTPSYARSMAHAVEADEKDAVENRKNVVNGQCSQVLRFYDGKSVVSVVLNYRVKDFKNASVVVRQDFVSGKGRPHRMSYNGDVFDGLECPGSGIPASDSNYIIVVDSNGNVVFRQ